MSDPRRWDHTRSPWWNLATLYELSVRETITGATAMVVLFASLVTVGARTPVPEAPVILSVPQSSESDQEQSTGRTPGRGGVDGTASEQPSLGPSELGGSRAPATPGQGRSEASTSSPSPQGGSAPTAPPNGGGDPNEPAPPPTDKDELVIGFMRQTGTGENAGFQTPNQGDPNGQINTLVKWLNDNGGLNGHPVRASIRTVDINNTGRPQEEANCRGFTEEDGAFAVVPLALVYAESRACYADHGTILVDPTPFHMPAAVYDDLAPYIWQTSYPSTSRMIRALAQSLDRAGFFEPGMKLGFVAPDTPYFRASFDTDATPAFATYGASFAEEAWVQNDSIPSTQQSLQQAAFRFQTQGVTHVVFYGNALLAPLFMTNAEANAYFPRYGLTSFDQPKFDAEQWATPASLQDAVGAGFSAAMDVPDSQVPFPSTREKQCLDIYAADGHSWGSRYDAKNAIGYCDAVFLLKSAADRLGARAMTAQNLYDAVLELGTSFQAPTSHGSRVVAGRQDLAASYRPMAYDTGCDCFTYTGGPVDIP